MIHRDLQARNLFVASEPDGSECLKYWISALRRSQSRAY